jgi:hypothetical protein
MALGTTLLLAAYSTSTVAALVKMSNMVEAIRSSDS